MNGVGQRSSLGNQLGAIRQRLLGLADEPTDDDDLRLRKRVGVVSGYIGILVPLQLPALGQGLALSWAVALTMPLVSALNLLVLALTRRFDRYVVQCRIANGVVRGSGADPGGAVDTRSSA